MSQRRVIAYVDGFNVFYGIKHASQQADRLHLIHGGDPKDCLGKSLYWLDIDKLVRLQLSNSDQCVSIKYFTAYRKAPKLYQTDDLTHYVESNERQRIYLEALRSHDSIELVLGWYSENDPIICSCGVARPNFEEKVTDVNIATHMLCDAYENRLDRALVISADADLVPPIEALKNLSVDVRVSPPPGRKRAKHLRKVANSTQNIKLRSLRRALLPTSILQNGLPTIECPEKWRKPEGWIWDDTPPSPL